MTGTVQSGKIAVNDEIEFPSLHVTRKVMSIQMFHMNMNCAYKGDRAGVCVQSECLHTLICRAFDFKAERGEACSVGSLTSMQTVLVRLRKIRFYKGEIRSGATFHISVGHHTIPATITLFADESKEGMI